jgi:molecular chaperone HtpG
MPPYPTVIALPKRFKSKIQDAPSPQMDAAVKSMVSLFGEIYGQNNLYFFDEYTDHGFRHVNSVLEQIDALIPAITWRSMTERDAVFMIAGTFLHDLGMHLQPLTFNAMIKGEYDDVRLLELDDKPWKLLWEEYIEEARKFSEEESRKLFGDPNWPILVPTLDGKEDFTENQRRLIGEFIRRHHPRMAYELAIKGLKTFDEDYIDLCPLLNEEYKVLAGLIARSHGMNVRDIFDILKARYSEDIWSSPSEIHIVYIMILLRLADYLQVDESRVLKIPYQTRNFKSPFSLLEHKKHLCIAKPQRSMKDKETIYFKVDPPNSIIYVSLQSLFNAIQDELDLSWAILSEAYHQEPRPQLTCRRIKSSLDDKTLNVKLPFVSELITFSADKELLKLLIAPLYGYDPSYGIRELLQNSVDACWEREWLENQEENHYKGQILLEFNHNLSINNTRVQFTITDDGKGMTLEEIKKYFLRAGSSLKKSEEWRKNFIDQHKTPSIHRIGKFGIGVLAAFLLGDEIFVETRHMSSDIGYSFSTKIDNENIEIQKRSDIRIGTRIIIFISEDVRDRLFKGIKSRLKINQPEEYFKSSTNWDKWFCLDNPKVMIKVDNHPEFPPYSNLNPTQPDSNSDWHLISTDEFPKILWTYSERYACARLCNNGIVVPDGYSFSDSAFDKFTIEMPYVSCFDYKTNLPLKLNRDSLAVPNLPFEKELIQNVFKDIIRKLIVYSPIVEDGILKIKGFGANTFTHPALKDEFTFLYNEEGYTINLPLLWRQGFNKDILVILVDEDWGTKNINDPGYKVILAQNKEMYTEDKSEVIEDSQIWDTKPMPTFKEGDEAAMAQYVSDNLDRTQKLYDQSVKQYWKIKLDKGLFVRLSSEMVSIEFKTTKLGRDPEIPTALRRKMKTYKKPLNDNFIKEITSLNQHLRVDLSLFYKASFALDGFTADGFVSMFHGIIGEQMMIPYNPESKKRLLAKLDMYL